MNVWLIRHAESTANAGEPSDSPGGVPLTALGHQQATAVAAEFEEPPGRVLVSPYIRTQQTAAPLVEKFKLSMETWPIHEWNYLDEGRYQGTTWTQRRPAVWEFLQRNDPDFRDGPRSESFMDLLERVDDFGSKLQDVEDLDETGVAVFSHGRFIKAVLWKLFCGGPGVIPREFLLRSYWTFADSFSVPNGLMLQLRRGPYGWFIHGRRDVRLSPDEERATSG